MKRFIDCVMHGTLAAIFSSFYHDNIKRVFFTSKRLYATKQLEHAVFCSLEWHMNKAAFWKAALSLITQVMIMPESAMNMLTQIGRTLWTSPLSYRCFDSHASPNLGSLITTRVGFIWFGRGSNCLNKINSKIGSDSNRPELPTVRFF
jgi:hypothetical protein